MLPVARNGYQLPNGVWGFYWRRIRRILPPYYLAMGFSLALIWLVVGKPTGTFWDMSLPVTPQAVASHLLLIHDFSLQGDFKINYVFWSIAVECQVYPFFPALVALWRRYPALVALALALGGSFGLLIITLATGLPGLAPPASAAYVAPYVGLFAMGMFAAGLRGASAPLWQFLHEWHVWEVVALAAFALLVTRVSAWSIYPLDLCAGVMGVCALVVCSHPGFNPLRAILEWRPLVWIGGFSYSLYLIHAPLVQALWQYIRPLGLGDIATYLALLIIGTPLFVLVAWGFWYLCERPFLNARSAPARTVWRWRRRAVAETTGAR